jgi:hypothetical protein
MVNYTAADRVPNSVNKTYSLLLKPYSLLITH